MPRPVQEFAVFLCSYNGERFLAQQLRSIAMQTVGQILLLISDDGSTDNTVNIINSAKREYPQLNIQFFEGPQRGFQYNFLSFFQGTEAPAQYIAFADQDDIWEPTKLERAKLMLEQFPIDQASLYGTRTRLIDAQGNLIGLSTLFKRKPCFANALVQNISGGHTMVMNAAAWRIINTLSAKYIVSHDWWAYQLITAVGGHIVYDPFLSVRYRQHEKNIVGANNTIKAQLIRIKMVIQNRFKSWNDINIAALSPHVSHFTIENQKIFLEYSKAREAGLLKRFILFKKSGVFRQTPFGTMGLWLALLFGKC